MRVILLVSIIVTKTVFSQRWAIRPELCLTAAKAKFVSNTNPYLPFRATYSNNPDIYLNVDYYLKKNCDRLTFTFGTHQNKFAMTGNEVKGNGYLGFLFPDKFLSEGTLGSAFLGIGYGKLVLSSMQKKRVYLTCGLQYYFIRAIGSGGAGGTFGNFVLYDTEMKRETNGKPGYHSVILWLIKDKKQHEVLQLSF
jgi:hypothetical protein